MEMTQDRNSRQGDHPEMVGVSKNESVVTLAAFAYFFFLIMAYYVLKPIRDSLAIELGSRNIPALNIFSMISLVGGNAVYTWIVGKFKPEQFIPRVTWFFIGCLGAFSVAFSEAFGILPTHIPAGQPVPVGMIVGIGSYFLWVNLFALFSVSMFWSFLNDVLTTDQGRRLYSFIGYGGLAGGLCGGLTTTSLAAKFGTAPLFLVAAGLLLPTIWLARIIRHATKAQTPSVVMELSDTPVPPPPLPVKPWDGVVCTCSSSLLMLLALEMFFYTFASSLFSYQINSMIEEAFPSRDLRVVYWANLYNFINGCSLLTQLALTHFILKAAVPVWGLLLLPVSQIVGSILLLGNPGLALAAAVGVFRYAVNYSTGRALRELTYTLVSRVEKYQGKGFIDTLVFRAGDGLGSVLLLWGLRHWQAGPWIDAIIIAAMSFSAIAIIALGLEFKRRTALAPARAIAPA